MDFSLLVKSALIYSTPLVRVYKGFYADSPVVIKELYLASPHAIEAAVGEFRIQQGLNHPNICKAYGCWVGEDGHSLTFVLEALEMDLAREIANRRNNSYPWQEAELWGHFLQLVSVFAYAQEAGVCHRDIKPQNIFVSGDKQLKVGDFGTAKVLEEALTTTVVGTPVYASPELQSSFQSGLKISYDPYRSDVYSLGLTFLCMARLTEKPRGESMEMMIVGLAVSEGMKGLLGYMLQAEKRPDFLELRQYLYSVYNYSAESVYSPIDQSTPQLSPVAIQALEKRLNSEQDWENALAELLSTSGVVATWSGECWFTCFGCAQMYSLRWLELTNEGGVWFCSPACCDAFYLRLSEETAPRALDVVEESGRETEDRELLLPNEEERKETKISASKTLPEIKSVSAKSIAPPKKPQIGEKTKRPAINIKGKTPPKGSIPAKSGSIPSPTPKSISSASASSLHHKPPLKPILSPTPSPGASFLVSGKSYAHLRKSPI